MSRFTTTDALKRRKVLLVRPGKDDVEVTLVFWPVPAAQRRPGTNRSSRAGAKPKVRLPSGARISVNPDFLIPLEGA